MKSQNFSNFQEFAKLCPVFTKFCGRDKGGSNTHQRSSSKTMILKRLFLYPSPPNPDSPCSLARLCPSNSTQNPRANAREVTPLCSAGRFSTAMQSRLQDGARGPQARSLPCLQTQQKTQTEAKRPTQGNEGLCLAVRRELLTLTNNKILSLLNITVATEE